MAFWQILMGYGLQPRLRRGVTAGQELTVPLHEWLVTAAIASLWKSGMRERAPVTQPLLLCH